MKLKGAIFDLDGTLLDSMPFWDNLGLEYLKVKGLNPPKNINKILKTMSLAQSVEYLKREYFISGSEDEIIGEIIGLIEDQYRLKIPLKTAVLPFLDRLYRNNVKMCIATATERELAKAALERLSAAKYFDFILTCTEAGMGKDTPEFFLKALELLNTPRHETIVFEDALHAIKSAKAAGFPVAAVYDKSSYEDQKEIISIADIYLNSFEDWEMIL
jgi:HAD superfamily hydrolase (TIGR01509 family)